MMSSWVCSSAWKLLILDENSPKLNPRKIESEPPRSMKCPYLVLNGVLVRCERSNPHVKV